MSTTTYTRCPLCASLEMPEKIQVEDLVIEGVTVSRAGQVIKLSRNEFFLLLYLMRNKDHVLTRAMIETNSFGWTTEGFTNQVDVYINSLRNKLDRAFTPKLIHTVRGFGYMLGKESSLAAVGA